MIIFWYILYNVLSLFCYKFVVSRYQPCLWTNNFGSIDPLTHFAFVYEQEGFCYQHYSDGGWGGQQPNSIHFARYVALLQTTVLLKCRLLFLYVVIYVNYFCKGFQLSIEFIMQCASFLQLNWSDLQCRLHCLFS